MLSWQFSSHQWSAPSDVKPKSGYSTLTYKIEVKSNGHFAMTGSSSELGSFGQEPKTLDEAKRLCDQREDELKRKK